MYIYKLNVCELLYTENQKFLYTDYMLLKASRNTKNGFIWILRGVFYIDVLQNLKKKKKGRNIDISESHLHPPFTEKKNASPENNCVTYSRQ